MSPDAAERIYRLLLRACPPDFRAEYGREMVLLFRDHRQESDVRSLGFWAAVIWDVARSALAVRAEAWRARGSDNTRRVEGIVKLAAVLTVLLGGLGLLGAAAEWVAGSKQAVSGAYELAVALGILASVLLPSAGVAILSGTPRQPGAARVGSGACHGGCIMGNVDRKSTRLNSS